MVTSSPVRKPDPWWHQSHDPFLSQHSNLRRQSLPQISEGECRGLDGGPCGEAGDCCAQGPPWDGAPVPVNWL